MSMNRYEAVIGLEIHTQLTTRSKIFSGAATAFGAEPNRQVSWIDAALPGTLPVLNREAVACAIRFGLAVNGTIAPRSVFARKNYFYPDLPKGYQISQYELPVVSGGALTIRVGDGANAYQKTVHLTRAHLEEDAGKSLHEDFHGMSGIDLNRAGTPLLEIVSEPEMNSAAEAVAYAKALHALVRWIGICDGNMQEGSFRVDANVSVRPRGETKLGTRREIKNLNSFRFLYQAIEYEIAWQIDELESGRPIEQATVLFDPAKGETRVMRTKEEAHDYRYFPDPDLLPLVIPAEWIERERAALPELPQALAERFETAYCLSAHDAALIVSDKALADFFVATVEAAGSALAKPCANWLLVEVLGRLNKEERSIESAPVTPHQLAALVARVADGTLSSTGGKQLLAAWWAGDARSADELIDALALRQVNDTALLEQLVTEAIAANPKSVAEYRAGKEKALNAIVGAVMKASKGKANPKQVTELIRRALAS
ncbi:aspartyl/glutamyl-tRNA(Asn/Gln) amidotransferase subunit B [Hydrogenophilus thermoluteolus]|uniref:Asp-tRNA(Asn)/Glu-tRNA(Gln) amidotransferase subunit GatB n=1 Tax=Hydrogenophilus thermoluteolus TaxID=297 RepID=UPI0024A13A0B|nr:Asp-tRNA(Asn)/Glu-tRNA(Gln) amidotransferase subunit GatB [Hydrogenophilus thermoluteolus]GLW61069.1 aspartyl/glutamyl-tRNA(Asn/Gln) amidotransferase subunit B [Hydrogenophilus thermoluteolus]